MTENVKKLLELASTNEALIEKLKKATKDEIIAIAKEQGITLTDLDLEPNGEIPEEELNAVSGGLDIVAFRGNLIIAEMNERKYNQAYKKANSSSTNGI